jgi:hypothetical protein
MLAAWLMTVGWMVLQDTEKGWVELTIIKPVCCGATTRLLRPFWFRFSALNL